MDVSIDNIRKTIEELCKFENRIAGTKIEHEAADYLVGRFEEFGFDEVIQHEFPVKSWFPKEVAIHVVGPSKKQIECALMPYSPSYKGKVQLVDLNSSNEKKRDSTPAFGLIEWGPVIYGASTTAYSKALEHGLDGVIISSPHPGDMLKILVTARGIDLEIPVFSISNEDGAELQNMLKDSEVSIKVKAVVEKTSSTSRNIEVVIPGSTSTHELIIGAHYDAWFVGAADNAAPVAVVVETARLLKEYLENGGELKRTVKFLLFGAEECGSEDFYFWDTGSRHYAESQESLEKCALIIGIDSIGYHATNYVTTTYDLIDFAKNQVSSQKKEDQLVIWAPPGYSSDHWFFTIEGVPTIYLISWSSDLYHTQKDTPDMLNYESIKDYAEYAANTIVDFSNTKVLHLDLMYQLELIGERINEYQNIGNSPIDLQSLSDVLGEILKEKKNLDEYREETEKSRDSKLISELNVLLRTLSGKLNRTIGLGMPVDGISPSSYLAFLNLIHEYHRLDRVISELEKMPIMTVSPVTRLLFRKYEKIPVSWAEVEKPLNDLKKEQEKLLSNLESELAIVLDTFLKIHREIEKLLK